ncbi:MAG: carboxypeptidase-like regulatory domain-containing protein [Gemmatimonadaceae bacterium]|nr:carboxypeptidase-like regulatory domain-containing protein [Gemmatimonadaceae bacterium]
MRASCATALLLLSVGAVRALGAQSTDVIRGRIIGPDSQPVENARITVTSIGGNVNRTARTDRNGRYTVTFPGGDGDYMVQIAAIGYAQKRFEIKRTAEQDILIGDAKLQVSATMLDAVEVLAPRDRVRRNDNAPDISGSERSTNMAQNAIPADQWGDLAAMAASLPGVQLVPGQDGGANGFSVLGAGADQNNATLNGLGFGGANLPRDAAVSSSLVTSPYDVSRGGFSGGQTQLRTRAGSNFLTRGVSLNFDSPTLQWSDRAAAALGNQFTNGSLGGIISGPISFDKAFFNVSYQLGRRAQDFQNLLNTSAEGLASAGVTADSVARFLSIVNRLGIPQRRGGIPVDRLSDNAQLFGAVDFTPPSSTSGQAFNLTFNGNINNQKPLSFASTELPTASGERTGYRGGIQGRHSAYAKGILTETSAGLNLSQNDASPYLDLPGGRVRVNSVFPDGTSGVTNLSFGGNQFFNTAQQTRGAEALNQLSWFSANNRHRLKLTSEFRYDGFHNDNANNVRGQYSFNSLRDLEDGRAAFYSRNLTPRIQEASQINGAISLGDSYRPKQDVQIQLGMRVDAQRFQAGPQENPEVESLFGVKNSERPNRVYVSPRVGFSWTYGTAAQVGAFDGAFRGPRAVVRGGIGVFQNSLGTQSIGNAIVNTGLPTALQQLTCAGIATPQPQWATWLNNPDGVPANCATGGGVFSNSAPNVSMFARDFNAPRSLRSNLQWSGQILKNRFNLTADGTYSLNQQQQGFIDRNVDATTRFTLASEGGRPVFVQPTSIVPFTGAIASRDAIVSPKFSRVTEQRSDLRSEARQLTLSLSPTRFSQRYSWSASYVLAATRDIVRGFQSTGGNPFDFDAARSGGDTRHQIMLNASYNFFDAVRVGVFTNLRSGNPFTPLIAGDVNGDGYSNDRAFIASPSTALDPALSNGMMELLTNGPKAARECLQRQLGTIAGRNSCEGPWTANANLSISFNPVKIRMPYRANLSFQVSNPLGAADLLLHGSNGLKGWGQPAIPDANLLYVRGFDPAQKKYLYEVNERFGATDPRRTAFRSPVTITALMRFDLAPTRERQILTQQLDRGRTKPGNRTDPNVFRGMYGTGGIQNPIAQLLRQADTLKLTGPQADSLATLNRWYSIRVDSIWRPVTTYLATLGDRYSHDEALGKYQRAREGAIDLLARVAPKASGVLTSEQKRKLPPFIASFLEPRYLASIRPGTVTFAGSGFGGGFGGGGGFPGGFAGGGGGGPVMQFIMR